MVSEEKGTLLGRLFPTTLETQLSKRCPRLFAEATIFSLIAVYLTFFIGFKESGYISIFLISASLTDRIKFLLDENRINIWHANKGGWQTNKLTSTSLLAIFLGIITAYFAVAIYLGNEGIEKSFSFALEAAGITDENLRDRNFAAFSLIFFNNTVVLVCMTVLAFVYRAYGAMLALSWNACVWAFAITTMTLKTPSVNTGGLRIDVLISTVCLLPHLILEGLAFIMATLSAIFLSKAVARYSTKDPRFKRIIRACATLFLVSICLILLAAAIESSLVPAVLKRL